LFFVDFNFGVLKVVAWGGWVLQIFCGLFSITIRTMARIQVVRMEKIHGEFQDVINCIEETNSSNEESE
jgi:hypothetical protein